MNQEKIGRFISILRKENNLTQDQLAEMLGVNSKSVSRWENGRCLPDISLFKPLCDIFRISINELLAGERTNVDDSVINYMNYTNKKTKRNLLMFTLIIFLLIIFTILFCYFINSYNKIVVYKLSAVNDNFRYINSTLTISNMKNILVLGNIQIANHDIDMEDIKTVCLKESENNLIICKNVFFSGVLVEDYGYNELFDKEKLKNLDNWYLEITYTLDDREKKDILPVRNEEIMRNNKFYSKPSIPIS